MARQSPLELAELTAQQIPPSVEYGTLPLIPMFRRCVRLILMRVTWEGFSGLNPESSDKCRSPPETVGAVYCDMEK